MALDNSAQSEHDPDMQSRSWPRSVEDGEPSKKEVIDLIAREILGQEGWSTDEAALLLKLSRKDLTTLHLLLLKAKGTLP